MKKQFFLSAALVAATVNSVAQTNIQMRNWYIAPWQVEMPQGTPTPPPAVTPIPGTPVTAGRVANGMYDINNNLLFYIADDVLYDYNNISYGLVNGGSGGAAEIAIVPIDEADNCQRKFNIFSITGGFASANALWQAVFDLNTFTLSAPVSIDIISTGHYASTEFGALAVGNPNAAGDRFLYWMAGSGTINTGASTFGQIHKLVISSNGNVAQGSPLVLYPPMAYNNDGAEIFAQELDISPDGSWLAWASSAPNNVAGAPPRYHVLELDPVSGSYLPGTYRQFDNPNAVSGNSGAGFRGVEFFRTSSGALRLFLGAGSSGIYYIETANIPLLPGVPASTDFIQVINSNPPNFSFGNSQIELSFNGLMYASSPLPAIGNIGAFNPSSVIPQIIPWPTSFTIINPPPVILPPKTSWLGDDFFTLPDQVDGQDYSTIIPATFAMPPGITINNFQSGSTTR